VKLYIWKKFTWNSEYNHYLDTGNKLLRLVSIGGRFYLVGSGRTINSLFFNKSRWLELDIFPVSLSEKDIIASMPVELYL